jgi:branched-chain amino acid transport system substrate-binding protein
MRRRYLFLIALLSVAALLATACPQQTDTGGGGGQQDTFSLAFVGPLTGPLANLGINVRNGAKKAVDEINKSGELDVRLELREYDTQGDPAQAQTIKDQFAAEEDVLGVVGPVFSGETKAILPTLQEESLPMISPSATNVELPNTNQNDKVFHRIVPDDDVQGKAVADYVTKVLKLTNLAFAHDNTDYGKGVAEGTRDLLKGANVTEATTATVDPKSQDYSAAVNQINTSRAPGLFYGGYYAEAGRLAKQLRDAGYRGTFISGDGSLDLGFVSAAGAAAAEGAVLTCACTVVTPESEGARGEFAKDYIQTFGRPPGAYSPEGYDVVKIFAAGIKAGNTTRAKMVTYVEGLTTYSGLSKEVKFLPNGNQEPTDVYAYQIKGGEIIELGTISELTGGGGGATPSPTGSPARGASPSPTGSPTR